MLHSPCQFGFFCLCLLYVLVQQSMLIEAGGEKATQLGSVPVHGRVRVQGEAKDFEEHVVSLDQYAAIPFSF
jgi:hypothetical protein